MHSKSVARDAEDAFRLLLRPEPCHTPTLCFRQDRQLRYTWIHSPHPGFNIRDVLGRTDRELVGKDEAAQLEALKRRVLRTGMAVRDEVRIQEDGRARYYDLTVEPLRNSRGEVTGISGFGFDVTCRRQCESDIAQQLADEHGRRDRLVRGLERLARDTARLAGKLPTRSGALEKKLRALADEAGRLAGEARRAKTARGIGALRVSLQLARRRARRPS